MQKKQTIILVGETPASHTKLRDVLNDAQKNADEVTIVHLDNPQDGTHTRIPHILGSITKIFILVGIPPNVKGYKFLREAVRHTVRTPDILYNMSRHLYPLVAKECDTTASVVEASIRHAIEIAWNRGAAERLNLLFDVSVFHKKQKPTNSELIALLADKILVDYATSPHPD